MPWFYIDDDMAFNRKIVAAGNPAVGLWARAGSWSRKEGTSGFIPADMARSLGTPQQIKKLLTPPEDAGRGLWVKTKGGYGFHEWDQRYDAEKDEDRRRKRSEAGRIGGIKSGASRRSGSKAEANASPKPEAETKQMLEQTLKQKRTPVLDPDGGSVGGVSPVGRYARAEKEPPPANCPAHPGGTTAPCRACGVARQAASEWESERKRAEKAAISGDARAAAEDRASAIAACGICDTEGYFGSTLCDHDPKRLERIRSGSAAVRAALAKERQ